MTAPSAAQVSHSVAAQATAQHALGHRSIWRVLVLLVVALLTSSTLAATSQTSASAATAIDAKHAAEGGSSGWMGPPVTAERCGLAQGGCVRGYRRAIILWSPRTGAKVVSGATLSSYLKHGREGGTLGYPTADKACGLRDGACWQPFQRGRIYWSPGNGAHPVNGATYSAWDAQKRASGPLGYPTTDKGCGSSGCSQSFERGRITWTAGGGTRTHRSIDQASSVFVLVNKRRPLNPKTHVPGDLRATSGIYLRDPAADAWDRMRGDASAQGVALTAISGYRSYSTQSSLYNGYVNQYGQAQADLISARPGYSEHQTGLTVDVGNPNGACALQACFETTPAGRWIANNGWKYGFIIRYPKGHTATTGYAYEPWHLRYVGTKTSTSLHNSGYVTYEGYLGQPKAPTY